MNRFYALPLLLFVWVCLLLQPAVCQSNGQQPSGSMNGLPHNIGHELERAGQLKDTLPEQAMEAAQYALQLATDARNHYAAAKAREMLGKICEETGETAAAKKHYEQQIQSARKAEDAAGIVSGKTNLAGIYLLLQNPDSAIIVLREAKQYCPVKGRPELGAGVTFLTGKAYRDLFDFRESLNQYHAAAEEYHAGGDSARLALAYNRIAACYHYLSSYDTALSNYRKCLTIREQLGDMAGVAAVHNNMAAVYMEMADYAKAIEEFQKVKEIATAVRDTVLIVTSLHGTGVALMQIPLLDSAATHFVTALKYANKIGYTKGKAHCYGSLGSTMEKLGKLDEALDYFTDEAALHDSLNDAQMKAFALINTGITHMRMKQFEKARTAYLRADSITKGIESPDLNVAVLDAMSELAKFQGNYHRALVLAHRAKEIVEKRGLISRQAQAHALLGSIYEDLSKYDSAAYHYYAMMQIGEEKNMLDVVQRASVLLAGAYANLGEYESAYRYAKMHADLQDSTLTKRMTAQTAAIEAMYRTERTARELELAKKESQLKQAQAEAALTRNYVLAGALGLVLAAAIVALIGYRGRRRAHERLKATQQQLLVQEKLASLGQLTAGIAHEIQNPLNFVNNFSDMTRELAAEAEEDVIRNGGRTPAEKLSILSTMLQEIRNNASRVSEHGRRASSIVNQMLQHARSDPGNVTDVDINKLLADVTDLAWHGMRARHKGMDVDIERDFDYHPLIVRAGPQELSRVFVNILNNAFDAVIERKEREPGFRPEVLLLTRHRGQNAEVMIRDNGIGIPDDIREKIFQPFYTTKPSGKGTGLGLSLSYDIVTQKYGGELEVRTKSGEYTEFKILLPLEKS